MSVDRFAVMRAKAQKKAALGSSSSEPQPTPRRDEVLNVVPLTVVTEEEAGEQPNPRQEKPRHSKHAASSQDRKKRSHHGKETSRKHKSPGFPLESEFL